MRCDTAASAEIVRCRGGRARGAQRRPRCLPPAHLESPDAPELLPAESPRPIGAVWRVRSPGALRWRRAGERCRRRTAVLPQRFGRRRGAPGSVLRRGRRRRRPATGQERRDPWRGGPKRLRRRQQRWHRYQRQEQHQEQHQQLAEWGSVTLPRSRQKRGSDQSPPDGRHPFRRPENRCAAVRRRPIRSTSRRSAPPPHRRRAGDRRRVQDTTQDESLPRRRRTGQARDRDRPAGRSVRGAPTAAPQGRRLGQRRPAWRPPGRPARRRGAYQGRLRRAGTRAPA